MPIHNTEAVTRLILSKSIYQRQRARAVRHSLKNPSFHFQTLVARLDQGRGDSEVNVNACGYERHQQVTG